LGLEFSDGRRAEIGAARPYPDDSAPDALVVMSAGGGGSDRSWHARYWVYPLPAPGLVSFVATWPKFGITEARVEIDPPPWIAIPSPCLLAVAAGRGRFEQKCPRRSHPAGVLDAVRSIRAHHAQLTSALADRVRSVRDAVRDGGDAHAARRGLVAFLDDELMPHAAAEERTLYAAGRAAADGRLLVEAMTEEHRVLAGQLAALRKQREPLNLALSAAQIESLFGVHLFKENELLLPLLLDTGADLRTLLFDTHHLLEYQ